VTSSKVDGLWDVIGGINPCYNSREVGGSYASSKPLLSQTRGSPEIRLMIPACRVPALHGAVGLDTLGGAWAPASVQSQASDVFYYPLD